ncbi:MAG: thiamine-phosphate kinase [Tagaea sp.]
MPAKRRGEFELIAELFRPLTRGDPAALGLRDDAALLAPAPDKELVVTADQLIAGTHTLGTEPAGLVAQKALRRNLSDLVAKGASFRGYFMTLALPRGTKDSWLEKFAAGLAEDGARYGIPLLGGDTGSTKGPLVVSITALGEVKRGRMIARASAKPGMDLFVTGTIGDAALGLDSLQKRGKRDHALEARYFLPEPRVAFATAVADLVSAAIDVSDGLLADLGHLARASDVAALVHPWKVPLSEPARRALERGASFERVLTGGDDYEVLFATEPGVEPLLRKRARRAGLKITRLGTLVEGKPGRIDIRDMPELSVRPGFTHF